MIKRNTEQIKDDELKHAIDFIQEEAFGKAIELSAAPTAGVPLLQDGEWGFFAGILYVRIQMNIYAVTPSSIIVVT